MNAVVKGICIAGAAIFGACALGFVGSYLAYSGQYVVAATTADDPALPSRSIGGYRYHLEVFGMPTLPVVVVVHGGPGGDYRYLLPLQALSDAYQVVFYDQRGSGLSPRVPAEQLGLGQSLEDLDAVIGSVSPHAPVRLIGHSWGAMLAAAYLERHPERVSHAVLAEPAFLTAEGGRQWFAAIHEGRPPLSIALLGGAWRAFVQSLYVYGPDADARLDFFMQRAMELDVPGHPLAGYYCGADIHGQSLPTWRVGARAFEVIGGGARGPGGEFGIDLVSRRLERYPHKVLLVAGSCNTIMGPPIQKQNLALFANAELSVIDAAGHTMFGERPEASLAVLRRYLSEDHSAIVASD
jgi:proline iminopeptidase